MYLQSMHDLIVFFLFNAICLKQSLQYWTSPIANRMTNLCNTHPSYMETLGHQLLLILSFRIYFKPRENRSIQLLVRFRYHLIPHYSRKSFDFEERLLGGCFVMASWDLKHLKQVILPFSGSIKPLNLVLNLTHMSAPTVFIFWMWTLGHHVQEESQIEN